MSAELLVLGGVALVAGTGARLIGQRARRRFEQAMHGLGLQLLRKRPAPVWVGHIDGIDVRVTGADQGDPAWHRAHVEISCHELPEHARYVVRLTRQVGGHPGRQPGVAAGRLAFRSRPLSGGAG